MSNNVIDVLFPWTLNTNRHQERQQKKNFSDGGIRTPVSAVKEHSDNPYTTSEIDMLRFAKETHNKPAEKTMNL